MAFHRFTDADVRAILDEITSVPVVLPNPEDLPDVIVVSSDSEDGQDSEDVQDDQDSDLEEDDLEMELLFNHNRSEHNLRMAEEGLKRAQELVAKAKEQHQITGEQLFEYYKAMEITLPTVIYNNDVNVPSPESNVFVEPNIPEPSPPIVTVLEVDNEERPIMPYTFEQLVADLGPLPEYLYGPVTLDEYHSNLCILKSPNSPKSPRLIPDKPFTTTPLKRKLDFNDSQTTPIKISKLVLDIADQEEIARTEKIFTNDSQPCCSHEGPDLRSEEEYIADKEEELWNLVSSWEIGDVEQLEQEILSEYDLS
jgi:hypothetical protein